MRVARLAVGERVLITGAVRVGKGWRGSIIGFAVPDCAKNAIFGTVGEPAIHKSPYFMGVLARTGYARPTGIIPIRPELNSSRLARRISRAAPPFRARESRASKPADLHAKSSELPMMPISRDDDESRVRKFLWTSLTPP
jgi:hypothetical protein